MAASLLRLVGVLVALPVGCTAIGEKPSSATEEAIQALDLDHSGKVEKSEVEAFAKSQGLSAAEVREEFKDLDTNGDGELGPDEIRGALAEPEVAAASATAPVPVAPAAAAAPVASAAAIAPAAPVASMARIAPVASAAQAPAYTAAAPAYAPASDTVVADSLAALSDGFTAASVLPSGGAQLLAPQPQATSNLEIAVDNSQQQMQAIEGMAVANSGKVLAEVFASRAAKVLASRSQDLEKASKLEETVTSLRGQAAEIKRTAHEVTAQVAKEAAQEVLRQSIDKIHSLEVSADQAAKEGAESRTRAKAAMDLALKAQADMRNSVSQLSGDLA